MEVSKLQRESGRVKSWRRARPEHTREQIAGGGSRGPGAENNPQAVLSKGAGTETALLADVLVARANGKGHWQS